MQLGNIIAILSGESKAVWWSLILWDEVSWRPVQYGFEHLCLSGVLCCCHCYANSVFAALQTWPSQFFMVMLQMVCLLFSSCPLACPLCFSTTSPFPQLASLCFIRAKRKPSWFRCCSKYLSKLLNLNSANFSLPLPFIFTTSYFLEGFPSPPSHRSMLLQFLETFCLLFVACSNSSLFILYSLTSHPDVVTITGQFDRIYNYLDDRHLATHEGLYLG